MKKRLLALGMVAALAVAAFTGCSSKEAAPAETEAAPETEVSAETEAIPEAEADAPTELKHLKVAFMANYASLWTVTTAIEEGYFAEQGLDVELVMFQDGPTEIAAMESGSIDIAYIGPGAHKLCAQGNAKIFCFSQLGNADCVMGLASHGVNSLEDLKGKTVAYASGTSSETILVRALASVGLSMDDITPMDMEVSNMVSAIVSGSVDAGAPWSPSSGTIVSQLGDDAQIFCTNVSFSDIAADCASWICMPDYDDTNHDTLVAFSKAIYKAMDFAALEENYDKVAEYVAKACGTDKDSALQQTGDGDWLTSAELIEKLNDGTIKGYYEIQEQNFFDSEAIPEIVPVEDFVLFNVMEEAAK